MRPVKTKIQPLGGSASLAIPMTLAKMYEWAPGAIVRAKLTPNGGYFEREVRELYGGRASGIIITKETLEVHDIEVGDEVGVPYYEWVTVKSVPWPEDGLEGQKKRAEKEKKAAKPAKKSPATKNH